MNSFLASCKRFFLLTFATFLDSRKKGVFRQSDEGLRVFPLLLQQTEAEIRPQRPRTSLPPCMSRDGSDGRVASVGKEGGHLLGATLVKKRGCTLRDDNILLAIEGEEKPKVSVCSNSTSRQIRRNCCSPQKEKPLPWSCRIRGEEWDSLFVFFFRGGQGVTLREC